VAYDRTDRVSEEVRRELAAMVPHALKDPRIPEMLSIVTVDVTRDLRYAKVRVSVMGSEQQRKDAVAGLSSAAGFLRHELSKKLQLRTVPELLFEADDSIEYSVHIAQVMQQLDIPPESDDPEDSE